MLRAPFLDEDSETERLNLLLASLQLCHWRSPTAFPVVPLHRSSPVQSPPHPSPDQGLELQSKKRLPSPPLRAPVPSAPFGPQAPTRVMMPREIL